MRLQRGHLTPIDLKYSGLSPYVYLKSKSSIIGLLSLLVSVALPNSTGFILFFVSSGMNPPIITGLVNGCPLSSRFSLSYDNSKHKNN